MHIFVVQAGFRVQQLSVTYFSFLSNTVPWGASQISFYGEFCIKSRLWDGYSQPILQLQYTVSRVWGCIIWGGSKLILWFRTVFVAGMENMELVG